MRRRRSKLINSRESRHRQEESRETKRDESSLAIRDQQKAERPSIKKRKRTSKGKAFVGTLAESLSLAAIGGLAGATATYLISP